MDRQRNLKNLKLALFDLDGTLIKLNIDFEKIRSRLRNFYSTYGINAEFRPMLKKIKECEREIERTYNKEEAKAATKKALEIIEEMELNSMKNSSLINFVKEVVHLLKAEGMLLGIVSRNSKKAIAEAIKKHGINAFDLIVAREDTDLEKQKPLPDPVLYALKKLKVSPQESIFVGDNIYDVASGKSAGVTTAAVLTGETSREELEKEKPDYIFKDLKELHQFLRH